MNLVKYIVEDARLGLWRNKASAVASIVLTAIALVMIGTVLFTRMLVADAIVYVESQLTMKVYVEDTVAVEDVAQILLEQSFVQQVSIEKGEALIERLTFFFEGKEHLLDAFTEGGMPDAVKLEVKDKEQMTHIAEQLSTIAGIEKVVYPQQMAESLASWISNIQLYGMIGIIIFFTVAFVMVYVTFHLSMFQRNRELKVKLFLGMNPHHVQGQLLLEGAVIGFLSALLAIILTMWGYTMVGNLVTETVPIFEALQLKDILGILGIELIAAFVLGITASYMSTRKLIRHV